MFTKEFKLKHVIKKYSSFVAEASEKEVHFGVTWYLQMRKVNDCLAVYFVCCKTEDKTNPWSIDTSFKFILASDEKTKRELSHLFDKTDGYGWKKCYKWENVIKNHVVNDTLTIECHVTIKKMSGCTPKRKINFEEPMHHLTDGVLKVGEKIFNVNKAQLAFRSTYFETLFFGRFNDSKKPKIELEEVDPDDFQCLLEAIYGESSVIQPENVEGVMKLADQFDVQSVRDKCEKCLLEYKTVDQQTRLRLADQYNLEEVKNDCLNSIVSAKDLKSSSPSDVSVLKPSTIQALYEKSISFL